MFSYLDRWRRSVGKLQESRLFLLDWGDAIFDNCVATLSDFRPHVVVCSLLTTLYLGTIVREKLGTALCCLNGSYYFGPGSRRAFDQDFAVADDPFVSEAIALFGQVDHAIHGTDAQFDPPPDPKPDNHQWVGPLLWEPRQDRPQYLDESDDPWALVSLSLARQSGEQRLAQIAMNVLSDYPVRTLLTLGHARVQDEFESIPANARI